MEKEYWLIASDIHDHMEYVDKMFEEVRSLKISNVFLLGDYCAPRILKKIFQFNSNIDMIWGNVDGDKHAILKMAYEDFSGKPRVHGDFAELVLNNNKIFLIHHQQLAGYIADSQAFDYVFYGNNHKMKKEKIGKTILLNPGSLGGIGAKSSFVLIEPNTTQIMFKIFNDDKKQFE